MLMKNPPTLDAIEPGTFRFVPQHLIHCTTAVPKNSGTLYKKQVTRSNSKENDTKKKKRGLG